MKNQAWSAAPSWAEPECRHLQRLIDRAVAGREGLTAIAAEPGIGKTRLTEEAPGMLLLACGGVSTCE